MAGEGKLLSKIAGAASPVGLAAGLAQGIFGIFQGAKMLKEAKKINPVWEGYKTSPYASAALGLAQTTMGARNPARAAMERQLYTGAANVAAQGQRAGLTPTQQAQLALSSLGQVEQGVEKFGAMDMAFQQQNRADLYRALDAMTGEERMKFQSMAMKFDRDQAQRNALRSAGQQNIMGAIGRIGATGYGASRLGGGSQGSTNPTGGFSQGITFGDFVNAAGGGTSGRPSPWDN
jgi:hypothetical protein